MGACFRVICHGKLVLVLGQFLGLQRVLLATLGKNLICFGLEFISERDIISAPMELIIASFFWKKINGAVVYLLFAPLVGM